MIKAWVNDINTTNYRIVVSTWLAAFGIMVVLIGVTFMGWEPTAKQERVLIGAAFVILTMMGFDVLQFWGKRFSDAGLAAAKNPNQPVNASVDITRTSEMRTPKAAQSAETETVSIRGEEEAVG